MAEQIKAVKGPKAGEVAVTGHAPTVVVRTLSGTSYPYFDLNSSIAVAEAVLNKGGGACDPDQLAAWLGYKSVNSGTYLTRVSAGRQFGLIESASGRITVSERAKTILGPIMPDDSIKAKGDAFLAVPLFLKVYEKYRGNQIPPDVGLINLFKQEFNILPDRAALAVSVFLRSADQADFRTEGKNRLIRPTAGLAPTASPTNAQQPEVIAPKPEVISAPAEKRGGGGDGTGGVHSAIVGLLRELPAPGTVWAAHKKQRFLDAFKATVDFIYPEKGEADDA